MCVCVWFCVNYTSITTPIYQKITMNKTVSKNKNMKKVGIEMINGLFWFGLILWYISHYWLFIAKSSFNIY